MNAVSDTARLLNAKELGRLLRLSKRQVHRLNSAGKIPDALRIGGSVRWSEKTICRWLEAGAPDRKAFNAMEEAVA